MTDIPAADILAKIRFTIRQAQTRWKPGKDTIHLTKRIALGHLPSQSTLVDYETTIRAILNSERGKVYLFYYQSQSPYPTVTAKIENSDWVVIINLDGTMETAFSPENLDDYLSDPAYKYVGLLDEFS